FVGVEELLEKVQALGVVVDELERHPHGVAGMELAQISHMHLGGEAGLLARLDVIEAAADELEGLVHRAIEQHVVIGHVEMAVVVDPAGLDPHQRGHERGEEYGFEIATVEHGKFLALISQRFYSFLTNFSSSLSLSVLTLAMADLASWRRSTASV